MSGARIEENPKWVRGLRGGDWLVDSRRSLCVWEHPRYPQWFFPREDIAAETGDVVEEVRSETLGEGARRDLIVSGATVPGAALEFPSAPDRRVAEHLLLAWGAADHWYEEDVEVFVHPRDPYRRIDVLPSSRRVRVELDDEVLADSRKPVVLLETGLPARFYLPATDVDTTKLSPTRTSTGCAYKGFAAYWSVTTAKARHEDLVWSYATPLPEAAGIAGLLCFYNEKVDMEVDGVRRPRPVSPFS